MISLRQIARKDKIQRSLFTSRELSRRYTKLQKLYCNSTGYMPVTTLAKKSFKNTCLVTGSARSIYTKRFRLSRHAIKAYFSFIRGLKNSSY